MSDMATASGTSLAGKLLRGGAVVLAALAMVACFAWAGLAESDGEEAIVPVSTTPPEQVTITKGEYEKLKRDAGLYRQRHAREGLGDVIFSFKLFGAEFNLTWWKLMGTVAALLFSGRWLVQMYYSRKAGKVVMPRLYWVLSIIASFMLLAYWILSPQRAMVGVLQNLFPAFVAVYNLYLDIRYHRTNGMAPADSKKNLSPAPAAEREASGTGVVASPGT